jgi:NAD(P)-dependent dehydrogenase (short-subunit alcohol dehydrogenase family)
MGKLAGKVAVVTGGGTGIGAATAELFVAEGASVLIVGRREDVLARTVEEIGGERISHVVADTSQVEDTQRYVAEAVRRYGGLDVLVSNAGIAGPFTVTGEDHSVEDFDAVIAVNLRGVWLSYKYALPELVKRGGGSVVLMSSIGGLRGSSTAAAYVASKHAVIGLAKTFALEGGESGVRVNAVCPGAIDTDMLAATADRFGTTVEALTETFEARVPVKRKGTSDEVAKLCLFLACDDSSYVTGSIHVIDGGVSAGIL